MEDKKDKSINSHYGHRERLRKKFLQYKGDSLLDYEMLELLLSYSVVRKDTKKLAKMLLKQEPSLSQLLATPTEELVKNTSLTERSALLLNLVYTLMNRAMKQGLHKKHVLASWSALLDYCFMSLRHVQIEHVKLILLNARMEVIKDLLVFEGTVNTSTIYPREIVKRTLDYYASGIILVHNHPSNFADPSDADIETTKQLKNVCEILDIHLHDHLIVSQEKVFSFKLKGLL